MHGATTIGEVAHLLGQPEHRIRRAADAVTSDLPRAGRYRLIPSEQVPKIIDVLRQRGHLPPAEARA